MINDYDSEEEEQITASEDLMDSLLYGIRMFYFSGSWSEVMLGVMLEENEDSFLVAMPAPVEKREEGIKLVGITYVPYIRFMKTEFRGVSEPTSILRESYLKFLVENSDSVFPGLMDMIGENDFDGEAPPEVIDLSEIKGTPKVTEPEMSGVIVNAIGLTDQEVSYKVKAAMSAGTFVPLNGKGKVN